MKPKEIIYISCFILKHISGYMVLKKGNVKVPDV